VTVAAAVNPPPDPAQIVQALVARSARNPDHRQQSAGIRHDPGSAVRPETACKQPPFDAVRRRRPGFASRRSPVRSRLAPSLGYVRAPPPTSSTARLEAAPRRAKALPRRSSRIGRRAFPWPQGCCGILGEGSQPRRRPSLSAEMPISLDITGNRVASRRRSRSGNFRTSCVRKRSEAAEASSTLADRRLPMHDDRAPGLKSLA
jgi:hypothetical protein